MNERHVFALEVGDRAAFHAQMLQRDMRWWYGLWARRRWNSGN